MTGLAIVCPSCRAGLQPADGGHSCSACGRFYADFVPALADLRLAYPDPQLSREDDALIARQLADRAEELDLRGLLDLHWRLLGKEPELAARFTAQELSGRDKAEHVLEAIEEHWGPIGSGQRVLEVGCGTGALAAAAARRGATVVASDLSLRWTMLAAKRIADEGADEVSLVCCSGEDPPFAPASFDLVLASDVIEHVSDPQGFVGGCATVLHSGGMLFLATPNRFSLGLEPHVRLPGVGYLPRALARRYVERVRGTTYDHVRLLSARALRRILTQAGFEVEIVPPEVPAASEQLYRGAERTLVQTYNRARRIGAAQAGLLAVGPFFHVFARRPGRTIPEA